MGVRPIEEPPFLLSGLPAERYERLYRREKYLPIRTANPSVFLEGVLRSRSHFEGTRLLFVKLSS